MMSDLPITASHRAARDGFANSSRVLARLREEWPKSQQEHSFAEMFARKYFASRGRCAAGTWEGANKSPCPRHPRRPAAAGNDGEPGQEVGLGLGYSPLPLWPSAPGGPPPTW